MAKKIVLACSECKTRNYSTNKTENAKTERIIMKKYCKICGKHTTHTETI